MSNLEIKSPMASSMEVVVETCNRVYRVLDDIKFESTDLILKNSKIAPPINEMQKEQSNRNLTYVKKSRVIPIAESIREPPDSSNKFKVEASNDRQYEIVYEKDFRTAEVNSEDEADRASFKIRGTLGNSKKIYRSLSRRIKNKFLTRLRSKKISYGEPTISPRIRETDRTQKLLGEARIQEILMDQARKAANLCNEIKEFIDSTERIESERFVLLADLKRKAIIEEIRRLTCAENKEDAPYDRERAEISIKEIRLNLRKNVKLELDEIGMTEWFVVVVSQGVRVWATRCLSCTAHGTKITFPDLITITDLEPSFRIVIQIYSMKTRNVIWNHEDKYRIRKHRRGNLCLPYRRFLRSAKKASNKFETFSFLGDGCENSETKSRDSSFVLSGFMELTLEDLSADSPWQLNLTMGNTSLTKSIDLSLRCRLDVSSDYEGYAHHGQDSGYFITWNRRWCVLTGSRLMFWNSPSEQYTKDPLVTIELRKCFMGRTIIADETICSKPRVLMIETIKSSGRITFYGECTFARDLLCLDTTGELREWRITLDRVLSALREWRMLTISGTLPVVKQKCTTLCQSTLV